MARKRSKTKYPGVYEEELANGDTTYYVSYRDYEGRQVFAKHGKKSHNKTAKTASEWRVYLINGTAKTRRQERDAVKQRKARKLVHLYKDHYLKDRQGRGKDNSLFSNWVKPFWEGKDIEKATNEDAANFRVWLESQYSVRGTPLSPQTVKHAIAMFRRIVRHAKKHIKGFTLQIDDFDVPAVDNEKTEDLTPEQRESLLKVLTSDTVLAVGITGKPYQCKVNRMVADVLLLIMNTGMRRGEVLKLQWQHVNFARGTILLKEPKGGKDVTIPMNGGAKAVLERQKKRSMFVFPGRDGGRRLHIDVQARKIRDLAGLPKDWRPCHGLRHYYGTELASKGVNMTVISELMGHSSIGVTKRYVKAREEQKIEAVELVSVGGQE